MSERTPLTTEHRELLEELRRTEAAARTHQRNFNLVCERALTAERRVEQLEKENADLRIQLANAESDIEEALVGWDAH